MVDRFCGRTLSKNAFNNAACSAGNDVKKLKEQLQIIDFSIIDTVLYLNAYPESKEALNYYHKLKQEREILIDTLSDSCNTPITNFKNSSTDKWTWIDSPWPWEFDAN